MEAYKNIGEGWSKSIVLENKIAIKFDFRHGAKKSAATPCKVVAKYISIYFDTFYEKLDDHQLDQIQKYFH